MKSRAEPRAAFVGKSTSNNGLVSKFAGKVELCRLQILHDMLVCHDKSLGAISRKIMREHEGCSGADKTVLGDPFNPHRAKQKLFCRSINCHLEFVWF